MEIKKLSPLLMILLISLFVSCGHILNQSAKQSIIRNPAQSNSPYQHCLSKGKKQCLGTFPHDQLEKKWWQLEYQFLNNKNELHKKYNQCYTKISIQCAKEYEFYELSNQLETLKSTQDIAESIADLKDITIWNDITIPGIKLAKSSIREIWTHVLAFKKMYLKIKKNFNLKTTALNVLHGKGVSIIGQAFAGAGIGITHEAIIHQDQLALFCAPGVYLKSDAGVSIDFNALQTLGCKSHNHYKGKFLSLELGASAEMFGLPLAVGLNYSLGIDLTNYLKILSDRTVSGEFDIEQLINELVEISNETIDKQDDESKYAQSYMAFLLAKLLGEKKLSLKFFKKIEYLHKQPILSKKQISISYYLKKLLKKYIIEQRDYITEKPNFYIALRELNNHLSECDAASVSAGLSLSLSPVSAGMSIHHYTEVARIDLKDILFLAKFSPVMLLNLNLPPSEFTRFKTALKSMMKIIPNVLYNKCITKAADKIYFDGKNIIQILRRDNDE